MDKDTSLSLSSEKQIVPKAEGQAHLWLIEIEFAIHFASGLTYKEPHTLSCKSEELSFLS